MYEHLCYIDCNKKVSNMFRDCTRHIFEDTYYDLRSVLPVKINRKYWLRDRINVETGEKTTSMFYTWGDTLDETWGGGSKLSASSPNIVRKTPADINKKLGRHLDTLNVLVTFRFFRRSLYSELYGVLTYDETLFGNRLSVTVTTPEDFNRAAVCFGNNHGLVPACLHVKEALDANSTNRAIRSDISLDDIDVLLERLDDDDDDDGDDDCSSKVAKQVAKRVAKQVATEQIATEPMSPKTPETITTEEHRSNLDDFSLSIHNDWLSFMRS